MQGSTSLYAHAKHVSLVSHRLEYAHAVESVLLHQSQVYTCMHT